MVKFAPHLNTYYSGITQSQIDIIFVRRRDLKIDFDANAIMYETVGVQHRPFVWTLHIEASKPLHQKRNGLKRINGDDGKRMRKKSSYVSIYRRSLTSTTRGTKWQKFLWCCALCTLSHKECSEKGREAALDADWCSQGEGK